MNDSVSTLERRLEHALAARAAAMERPCEPLPFPVPREPRRSSRHLVWVMAAAAALAVVALLIVKPFASDSQPATPTITTDPQLPSTTTPLPAPPADAGAEVPLTTADTEDSRFLIRMELRKDPTAHPVAVVSPGVAPIVVVGACMTIAAAPVPQAGYQGSCVQDPATSLVGTVNTADKDAPGSKAYGAWLDVPDGTAYVTYAYGDERWWQRPVDGIVYTVTEGRPPLGGERFVVRAFDASGRQLAEISRTPIKDATGAWDWF
jgi:hypothetical protein